LAGVIGGAIGVTSGVVGYTFFYAKGASYLTNDPRACMNCHIMRDHYEAWTKASHHAVASCNDCHAPKGLIPKYLTKASNGFWHSVAFTSGHFPEPLRIKEHNRKIVEGACRKCHESIVHAIEYPRGTSLSCVQCHSSVGHMK